MLGKRDPRKAVITATKTRIYPQQVLRYLGATTGVSLATVILSFAEVKETAAGLVFLTMVVWFAARSGIRLALFVAFLGALSFDYFFLQPRHTLRLAGLQEWIEMLSFAVSSVVVGRLAERARRQARQAESRRQDVERLYTLSQQMMLYEDAAHLVRDLPGLIERSFALDSVVLYMRDHDQFYTSVSDAPVSVQAALRDSSLGNSSTVAGADGFASLALILGMKSIGALAWRPDQLSREAASAVGAQVAIALTRALAIETYTRLEAAREGERLRAALIDSLTHELRTPLTTIRAAAGTLVQAEGLDDAARRDLAALVDEESARLDKLIGEAVEMAEIDANVVQVHAVPQSARTLLEQAVEEARGALASHRVVIAVEGDDPPALFDPHLLGRVLRHLLENAARYSPRGSRITLRSRRTEGRLEFSVEDNGPGIDSADLPLIFEKFYRGKKGKFVGKGTGMGLAIARAILAAHGGAIEVSSLQGQGAIFRFWVPLIEQEPEDAE
jgi:two-component system sensor histidine kinase KdpD